MKQQKLDPWVSVSMNRLKGQSSQSPAKPALTVTVWMARLFARQQFSCGFKAMNQFLLFPQTHCLNTVGSALNCFLFSTDTPEVHSYLNQAIDIRQKEVIFQLILELGQQPLWKMRRYENTTQMSLAKHKMIMCDSLDDFIIFFCGTKSSEILSVACVLGQASTNHHLCLSLEVTLNAEIFQHDLLLGNSQ